MIEAQGLTKHYGQFVAVSDLHFSIASGSVVGLLGPNGAGKSTTMRMLTTFLAPSAGTATVAGFDVLKQSADVRRSIGYLPETPPLYPELTVREYLHFVARIKGVPKREVKPAVQEVIERCFLTDVHRKLCSQISRGFRQRVGIAGALVHKPPVIILDEPTSGLDPAQIIEIRKLIRDLQGAHTVVLSTHTLPEVSEVCSHVVIIAGGRKVADGSLSELTKETSLEALFLKAIAGVVSNDLDLSSATSVAGTEGELR